MRSFQHDYPNSRNFVQNYSVEFLRDDLPAERRAQIIESADDDGFSMSIDPQAEIDASKIPAGIFLVGDDGIYIMSNAADQEKGADGKLPLAYADEANPETMSGEAVYDAKRRIFGGDDGVDFLPAAMIASALDRCGDQLVIEMTEMGIRVMIPEEEGPAPQ